MNRDLFWEIAFSSLLHDIGKFYMRGSKGERLQKHPAYNSYFSNFLDEKFKKLGLNQKNILLLSQHHHDHLKGDKKYLVESIPNKERLYPLARIICEADNISSGERYDEEADEYKKYEEVMMDSIFSFISTSAKELEIKSEANEKEEKTVRYRTNRLDRRIELIYDEHKANINFSKFVDEFNQNLEKLEVPIFKNIEDARWAFFISLLSVLKFYLFLVPSDVTKRRRDVSLFDHLKTTCAIATALYLWHSELGDFKDKSIKSKREKKFLLISGDVGGIQNFISGFKNIPGYGGSAKRLRARSFKVNALSIGLGAYIVKKLGLTYASVIYNTGGKFLILAPNTKEVNTEILKIKNDLEKQLIEEFGGILNISLAFRKTNAEELTLDKDKGFGCRNTLKELNQKLLKEKSRMFFNYLIKENYWNESVFVLQGKWSKGEYCSICESFPGYPQSEGKRVCNYCEEDKNLGGQLFKNNYAVVTTNKNKGFSLGGPLRVDLRDEVGFKNGDIIAVNIKNEILSDMLDSYSAEIPSGLDFRFSPYYAPLYPEPTEFNGEIHDKNTPVVFEHLASYSQGDKSLGVLKADVDRLGQVLSTKFDSLSLSRLSTFSFLLDYFFSFEFIEKVKKDFPNTYVVFAGGDDLFCLGPWDNIVKLSYLLQDEFKQWVALNRNLSISGAVVLVDSRLPFYEISRIVNAELSLAKKDKDKGKISIFGKLLKHNELKQAFEIAYEISKLFDPEIKVEMRIPRNTFQKLIEIYYEWEDYQNDASKQKLPMYAPHLAYLIYRTESLNPNEQIGKANYSLKILSDELTKSLKLDKSKEIMPKIGILSNFVLLLTRQID